MPHCFRHKVRHHIPEQARVVMHARRGLWWRQPQGSVCSRLSIHDLGNLLALQGQGRGGQQGVCGKGKRALCVYVCVRMCVCVCVFRAAGTVPDTQQCFWLNAWPRWAVLSLWLGQFNHPQHKAMLSAACLWLRWAALCLWLRHVAPCAYAWAKGTQPPSAFCLLGPCCSAGGGEPQTWQPCTNQQHPCGRTASVRMGLHACLGSGFAAARLQGFRLPSDSPWRQAPHCIWGPRVKGQTCSRSKVACQCLCLRQCPRQGCGVALLLCLQAGACASDTTWHMSSSLHHQACSDQLPYAPARTAHAFKAPAQGEAFAGAPGPASGAHTGGAWTRCGMRPRTALGSTCPGQHRR